MFGTKGSSAVSAGMRIAQLRSRSSVDLRGEPDVHYTPSAQIRSLASWIAFRNQDVRFHDYHGSATFDRGFHGIGPKLSRNASVPLVGNSADSTINFDWGVNAALLFGRQRARVHHQMTGSHYHKYKVFQDADTGQYTNAPPDQNCSHSVTILNVGAFAGTSFR